MNFTAETQRRRDFKHELKKRASKMIRELNLQLPLCAFVFWFFCSAFLRLGGEILFRNLNYLDQLC